MRRRKKKPPAAGSWLWALVLVAAAAAFCLAVCDMEVGEATVILRRQVVEREEEEVGAASYYKEDNSNNRSSKTTTTDDLATSEATGGEQVLVVEANSRASLACLAAHDILELAGSPMAPGDTQPMLVFWFKDEQPAPIYTLDGRQSGDLSSARHYAPSQRYRLDTTRLPQLRLLIEPTQADDSARYRCRVDFRRAPTVSRQLQLLVQVPTSKLEIRHVVLGKGADFGRILREDSGAHFACLALDGSPPPQLQWLIKWANESRLTPLKADDSRIKVAGMNETYGMELSEIQAGELQLEVGRQLAAFSHVVEATKRQFVTASQLTFRRLTRPLHLARLYCRASQSLRRSPTLANYRPATGSRRPSITGGAGGQSQSNNSEMIDGADAAAAHNELQRAHHQLAVSLELELRLRPQLVEIALDSAAGGATLAQAKLPGETSAHLALGSSQLLNLNEGEQVRLVCRSRGSHPPARLVWRWALESAAPEPLLFESSQTAPGNSTSSALCLNQIGGRHHLAKLQCGANNPELEDEQPLLATLTLHVKYKPRVRLIEKTASPQASQSNQSRLLECQVQSNPPINQLVWLADGRPLTSLRPPFATSQTLAKTTTSRAEETERADEEPSDCELLNWRTASAPAAGLELGSPPWLALDPCKRLVVMRGDGENDDKLLGEKYKCSAINIMGETSSSELGLEWDYRPRCSVGLLESKPLGTHQAPTLETADDMEPLERLRRQLVGVRVPGARHTLACPLEARPPPAFFEWWLVHPAALADLNLELGSVARLNSSRALRKLATERNELGGEPLALARREHALVLCRARNRVGWQEEAAACPQLPSELWDTNNESRSTESAPDTRQTPPDANCSLEAHEMINTTTLELQLLCPSENYSELLFQLATRLRDKDNEEGPKSSSLRLLAVGQRLALLDLLPDRKWGPQLKAGGHEQQRVTNNENNVKDLTAKLSLSEQVELLPRLVFQLRSSDLRNISAPNAIYGHQVRLVRQETAHNLKLKQQESAAHGGIMLEDQPQLTNIRQQLVVVAPLASSISGAARRSAAQSGDVSNANGSGGGTSSQVALGDGDQASGDGGVFRGSSWSQRRLEVAAAAGATGGTLLLSALTLTLIVLLLRAKRNNVGHATSTPGLSLEETRPPQRCAPSDAIKEAARENGLVVPKLTNGVSNNWLDKANQKRQQPDFMAPPVVSTGSTYSTLNSRTTFGQHAQPETLYVIEGDSLAGANNMEAGIESPSVLTSEELHQLCRTELLHVQNDKGGEQAQQLLSYCSPTTCASSLTHCDELSDLAQAQIPAQFVRLCGSGTSSARRAAQRNSAEEDECATELTTGSQCSSSDFHQHHLQSVTRGQQHHLSQQLPSGAAYIEIKGPPVIIKASGAGQEELVGDKSDSLYLFSFL